MERVSKKAKTTPAASLQLKVTFLFHTNVVSTTTILLAEEAIRLLGQGGV
jgi:hypothetical protein